MDGIYIYINEFMKLIKVDFKCISFLQLKFGI
jgi:hypothetical protein